MKALELKFGLSGGESLYLVACPPDQQAYQVKKWMGEHKPQAQVLYAGLVTGIKEYQAARWVIQHRNNYQDYAYPDQRYTRSVPTAVESIQSALRKIQELHGIKANEVLIVRARRISI